ncbi:hypothetical protein ACTQ49_01460 [Luteococcus sp. Sow4_B9]|uniref:hypothetical protein n=1 Tax=Luteococcus sp. Sow4_B9 TaxID=3438792 RepID=UPI003F978583
MRTLALAASLAATGAVAAPQVARADSWQLTGTVESCHAYSFGTMCNVTKKYKRVGNSYCDAGLKPGMDAGAYWSYCYKEVRSTVYK